MRADSFIKPNVIRKLQDVLLMAASKDEISIRWQILTRIDNIWLDTQYFKGKMFLKVCDAERNLPFRSAKGRFAFENSP
jgi:hypothetical protein